MNMVYGMTILVSSGIYNQEYEGKNHGFSHILIFVYSAINNCSKKIFIALCSVTFLLSNRDILEYSCLRVKSLDGSKEDPHPTLFLIVCHPWYALSPGPLPKTAREQHDMQSSLPQHTRAHVLVLC